MRARRGAEVAPGAPPPEVLAALVAALERRVREHGADALPPEASAFLRRHRPPGADAP